MELVPLYHQAGAVRLVPPLPVVTRPVTTILVPQGPAEGEPIEDQNQ
jgi:hypothetical protein